jgi:hypothetical protein
MSYLVRGNIVERTQEPRFRVVVRVNENRRVEAGDIEWIDDPPLDIYSLNGYIQQALDAWNREQTLSESD